MATHTDTHQGYSIMEAAKLSGLPESTLRYYETISIIDPIYRDPSSKHRIYSEDDINTIVSIACLSATGMTLRDMRQHLKNRERGAQAVDEQIALLTTQKRRLANEARYQELRQRYVETKIAYWHAVAANNELGATSMSESARSIAKQLQLLIEE
jgi:DNA-binding transcriptional MerR regulator